MRIKRIINKLKDIKEIRRFIIWFYLIGVVGLLIPATSPIFIQLTPLALLMNFGLLMINHESKFNIKTILIFSIIFILGIVIEIIGVQTGLIFGEYTYGKGLGLMIWDTPIIIGMNWLLLVYTTAAITQKIKINHVLRIALGAGMMLIYDLVMEQVAPKMDMWSWQGGRVPVENYLAWFGIAAIFHAMIQFTSIKIKNKLSETILLAQFVFFVILLILM